MDEADTIAGKIREPGRRGRPPYGYPRVPIYGHIADDLAKAMKQNARGAHMPVTRWLEDAITNRLYPTGILDLLKLDTKMQEALRSRAKREKKDVNSLVREIIIADIVGTKKVGKADTYTLFRACALDNAAAYEEENRKKHGYPERELMETLRKVCARTHTGARRDRLLQFLQQLQAEGLAASSSGWWFFFPEKLSAEEFTVLRKMAYGAYGY